MLSMMRVVICLGVLVGCSGLRATEEQDALSTSMRTNFYVNHGAPPTLAARHGDGLHAEFRQLDQDMANYSGEVQIDNYICDDDDNYSITIVWKRGDLTRDQTGILIATSANIVNGAASEANCTQLAAESAAYADGGDQTATGENDGSAGNALATVKASSSLAWSCAGISYGGTGGASTAVASHTDSTAATNSVATAFQSSYPSWQGNSATATADETGSVANAYGANSSGTAGGTQKAKNGGAATAHATGAAHAYGGNGANGVNEVDGGNGGNATANGGSGTTSTGGKGGDQTGGDGVPGTGGAASGNGTNTNGANGQEV